MNSYKKYLNNKQTNKTKLRKYLSLIFDDLYNRVERIKQKKEISLETFGIFFQYSPFLSKILISSLISSFYSKISKDNFINLIPQLYCGTFEEKMELFFKIFSTKEKDIIEFKNIKLILYHFQLINNSNDFKILNKLIKNLNINENEELNFKQWKDLNSRNSDLFYLINYFINKTKPFNEYVIDEIFLNEINIKNEENQFYYIDKISNNLIEYLAFLNGENEDIFEEKNNLSFYFPKKLNHIFYKETEDILSFYLKNKKNQLLNAIELNLKILKKSKSYSNIKKQNNQNDNTIITENSSTQCEDDSQLFDISNNLSMIEEEENHMKKNIKVLTYNSKEKKLIENTIEFIGNIIKLNYNDSFKLIDLRYSFFEIISKKTQLNNIIFDKRIDIYGELSFNRKHSMKLLFDNEIDYNNFISKIPSKKMFSTFNQKYEMKEKIGIGGFAEVFKVKNKETSEIFAVKIFHKNDLYLNEKISSLYNEINFLKLFSNINHENLVKTYEIYENQNDIYCIIDYVSNNNLYNYLIKNPNITLKEIKKIIKQILNGISYIETLGIIHQDLKLENIMIKEDNNNLNVKIIDFGLSIILLKNEFSCGTVGTPNYMAPEIINGDEYNYKIDIWSLGVILYFMRYRKLPFDDCRKDSRNIIYENIRRFRIKFGDSLLKISQEDDLKFKELILKCLNINIEKRISIKELKDDSWFSL